MKYKIVFLSNGFLYDSHCQVNGTLVQQYNLSQALSKRRIQVHYVCTTNDLLKSEFEKIDNLNIHWIRNESKFLLWKKTISCYEKKLIEIKPDAVYVRGRSVLQFVASKYCKKYNKKYIWATNGTDGVEFWKSTKHLLFSNKNRIKKFFLLPLKLYEDQYINKGIKSSDIILNQTVHQKKMTEMHLRRKGILFHNYFPPAKRKKNKKKNKILWLSTLSPSKQPEIFINVSAKINRWQFVLGGSTDNYKYLKKIKDLCKKENIKFLEKVKYDDSFRYYEESKLYINTSGKNADGLPNSFIQSWLCSTPVISLNHNPNKWFDKYEIGYCANGNVKLLKEKIYELVNDPCEIKRLGLISKKFAEEKFTSDLIIDKFINLI